MPKYRKKPVVIEAEKVPNDGFLPAMPFKEEATYRMGKDGVEIQTLEGWLKVGRWDYIVKGVKGEFYPVRGDIFDLTYEPVS
jgi:hypothetical protein